MPCAVPPKCDATCFTHLNGVLIAHAQPGGEVRERAVRSPERIPEELILHRYLNAIEEGEFVRRAVQHAFRARAIVAADINDEGVVELAQILHGLDDAADLVVGVSQIRAIDVHLSGEEFFLRQTERIPFRQFLRPRGQLGVGRA